MLCVHDRYPEHVIGAFSLTKPLVLPGVGKKALAKIFQDQHLRTSSTVDELVQDDLFRPAADAVHAANPLHLLGGLESFGHILLLCHLPGEQFHAILAGFVDSGQVLIRIAGY